MTLYDPVEIFKALCPWYEPTDVRFFHGGDITVNVLNIKLYHQSLQDSVLLTVFDKFQRMLRHVY
jgi:hypothetical protein